MDKPRIAGLLLFACLGGAPLLAQAPPPAEAQGVPTVARLAAPDASLSPEPSPEPEPLEPAAVLPVSAPRRCVAREGESCGFRWGAALQQTSLFLAAQHLGNISNYDEGVLRGPFFREWFESVRAYRFHRWSDDDPWYVDYVGHPLMGAVAGRIQIQNDPNGMALEFGWNRDYIASRTRAFAWSAVYSAQWELGPVSETSLGNFGRYEYVSPNTGRRTNGTGLVDLVVTPVAGTAVIVLEDALDRWAIQRLEHKSRNPAWLLSLSLMNPSRSAGNLLRFKAPWHRDDRVVRPAKRSIELD